MGKGNKRCVVSLSEAAVALFRDIPVSMVTRRVFWHSDGQPFRNVATRFSLYGRQLAEEATKKGTEFRRFRFHDLRHRFAVDYLRTGRGGIYELQHELGHTSLKVTEGYLAFLTADEAQAAKETAAQKSAQVYRFTPAENA
nr:tyrosine-type recombinase/integrase [Methylobacterium fujisawaense]